MLQETYNRLNEFETSLDWFDYIPIVSSISAVTRATLAVAEVVAGIALITFMQFKTGTLFLAHAQANAVRAYVAALPLVGNLFFLFFDNGFQLGGMQTKPNRFAYPHLEVQNRPPPPYEDLPPPPYDESEVEKPVASAPPDVFAEASAPDYDDELEVVKPGASAPPE